MTIEEMMTAIKLECDKHSPLCTDGGCTCPLYHENCDCIPGRTTYTDDEVVAQYQFVFGDCRDNPVTHPSHYTQGNIECIDAMESAFGKDTVSNFCMCNAFKYVWRATHKNGIQDIDKAIWYLNKFKELSTSE